MSGVSTNSPYYPYEKVMSGNMTMEGAEKIPTLICKYLMDLPSPNYFPPDNNDYPRCRFMKYLWYDDPNPLAKPVPTVKEKLSMLYDGRHPVANTDEQKKEHPKGFRIYPMYLYPQAQLTAQTMVKVYIDRVIPQTPHSATIGISFDIQINGGIETTLSDGNLSKAFAMETALISALNGVNILGVGTMTYDRNQHYDDGSHFLFDNVGVAVGRSVTLSLLWQESGNDNVIKGY